MLFIFAIMGWGGYEACHSPLFPSSRGCARRYVMPSVCLVWIRLFLRLASSRGVLSSSAVMGMYSIVALFAAMTDLLAQT